MLSVVFQLGATPEIGSDPNKTLAFTAKSIAALIIKSNEKKLIQYKHKMLIFFYKDHTGTIHQYIEKSKKMQIMFTFSYFINVYKNEYNMVVNVENNKTELMRYDINYNAIFMSAKDFNYVIYFYIEKN